jgi:hypothetical protein
MRERKVILKNLNAQKNLLLATVSLLFAGRLLLIQKGFLEDTDEYSFLFLIMHFDELLALNIEVWTNTMFHASSTIPETFIRLIQILFLKAYAVALNIPITSTKALSLIGFFNALISIFNLYLFYRILIQLRFSSTMAITGMVLLGCTLNFNIYIRHILPYETGLMFQLLALYTLLINPSSLKSILKSGTLSAFGFANYFGYFMFVFILLGFILIEKAPYKPKIKKSAYFLVPFIVVILLIELLSQIAGDSYIMHMFLFSNTVIQGSPHEGLIYVFKYFFQVEKLMGISLLMTFGIGVALKIFRKERDAQFNLMILSVLAYLMFGSYVFFFEKMVFYGRVLHMYYPFIVMGGVYFLAQLRFANWVVIPLGLLNFGWNIAELNALGYPRSIINELLINESGDLSLNYINELSCAIDYQNPEYLFLELPLHQPKLDGSIELVNFCFFNHYPDDFINTYKPYRFNSQSTIILEKPHFMSHKAYGFEYCSKKGRYFFSKVRPNIYILKNSKL